MGYDILRGENQIGGTITKIFTDSTSIFIDFGMELNVEPDESTDAKMVEMIEKNPPDAVLFTHIHGDHIGLLADIPDSVKEIYIGEVACRLMLNIRNTLIGVEQDVDKRNKLIKEKEILEDKSRIHFYEEGKEYRVGDIVFKPYLVDHSVCDAYMLKLYVDGKTIIHTGDFRNHGRQGKKFMPKLENQILTEPIDILITEGTMMSRSGEDVKTEEWLEDEATKLLMENKYAFLICSSTNLESLVSFQQAMIRSGRGGSFRGEEMRTPPFIANSYIMAQLNVFREAYGKNDPKYAFARSYPIQESLEHALTNDEKQIEYMKRNGFLMMVGTSNYYLKLMEKFEDCNPKPIVIYAMWEGYLDKEKNYARPDYIAIQKKYGDRFRLLHTSGHATARLLAEVIRIINPREKIRPVHTENAEGFMGLDIPQELKDKVYRMGE